MDFDHQLSEALEADDTFVSDLFKDIVRGLGERYSEIVPNYDVGDYLGPVLIVYVPPAESKEDRFFVVVPKKDSGLWIHNAWDDELRFASSNPKEIVLFIKSALARYYPCCR